MFPNNDVSSFCPALQVIAEKMKMSHNVAGVTLLALGNGAPGTFLLNCFSALKVYCNELSKIVLEDIFSSLAGIRQGRAELAFGELFGMNLVYFYIFTKLMQEVSI